MLWTSALGVIFLTITLPLATILSAALKLNNDQQVLMTWPEDFLEAM
ncbi:MAG: hypothetical protein H6937_09370 [Burkholderiales bacterium]|nr:hypothetical protein [Burkholderiales bacterium]MDR4517495.1 hypothetical protein [Nitrosomonas sp.]